MKQAIIIIILGIIILPAILLASSRPTQKTTMPPEPTISAGRKQDKLSVKIEEPIEEPIIEIPPPPAPAVAADNERRIVPSPRYEGNICTRSGGYKVTTHHGMRWHCVYRRR